MTCHQFFESDYQAARHRFLAVSRRSCEFVDSVLLPLRGPHAEELSTDVARVGPADAENVLVLSSALHGVEGFFGSAVQLAVLDALSRRKIELPRGIAIVLIHALNPWGFAWLRRTDAENIDSNRNFLLPGESFEGCPDDYRRLDPLLNPPRDARRRDLFTARAAWQVLRHGMPAIKQAIARGQYEFPKGLFFGGKRPGAVQRMLDEHLADWIGPAKQVLHLDFHTGLGVSATYRLLLDHQPADEVQRWLQESFAAETLGGMDPRDVAYEARGGIGRWCRERFPAIRYATLCAEFGTYPPIAVLRSLRAENQAHHWSREPIDREHWTKRRFVEVFCPASEQWRRECIRKAVELVEDSIAALS